VGSGSDDVLEHYGDADERGRLDTPLGVVEFERTIGILAEHLPRPPAVVADIGGGPGRYSLWLAEHGYTVRHRDLVPKHVEQLRANAADRGLNVETAVGDARAVDLADGGADAMLLLGPLYHLPARDDRLQALREAARVVRPGGPVFAAAISRWAPRLHGELVERLDLEFPSIRDQIETVERTGRLPPLFPNSFSGYCHRPAQLRAEVRAAGLDVVDLVNVEGIAFALTDLEARLADPRGRAVVLDAARELARVPELLGIGPHLLATARRPISGRDGNPS
jgi:SAM-dependent methyltransferase